MPGPYTVQMIRTLLQQDEAFLYKALLLLFERQTQDEQDVLITKHRNGAGFSSADGTALSMYAVTVKNGGKLYDERLIDCRDRILKYAKQLHELGDELL